ncbi:Os02g0530850 [Oryza sativa Japonica Group]|uniref:Os02g0530850 protein n=1 Tax=Oryza sativa subsp. japonica TaxID=39947 RepID=C7IYM0_ORYSJ|nr:Os02g0530850 [Oryza sativa Japonica Group]|eukprot:NP_001173002.1 Os02g0530850 [Oryza sativa Japonica Group]
MAPSKAWMGLVDDRLNHEYLEGVEKFIDYAFSKLDGVQVIRCPCIKCCNTYSLPRHIVSSHLKAYGILRSYTFWYHHGEVLAEQENDIEVDEYDSQEFNGEGYNGMQDLMENLFPQCNTPGGDEATHESTDQGPEEEPNTDAAKFYALLDKYNQPLYEGSRTSKLSALVNLLHVKNLGKWSNKSFTALLELLRKDFLPHDSTLPNSYYEAKKTIQGSIAEGYIADEFMTLSSRYLDDVETKHNRPGRIHDTSIGNKFNLSIFSCAGRPIGSRKTRDLDMLESEQAHIYILRNCDEVQEYISEYCNSTEGSSMVQFTSTWNKKFINWFKEKIYQQHQHDKSEVMEDLLSLSRGPLKNITCFTGYDMNGFRYRTERRDSRRCTQNSGVMVLGDDVEYYGVLTEILEIQYLGGRRVPLFRCNWVDVFNKDRGIRIDKYGLTSVNLQRLLQTDEPFVLASQAAQVFFVKDNQIKGWHLIEKMQPRDTYQVPAGESDDESTEVVVMISGRYGRNRVSALQNNNSKFISPGLLQQQVARRTAPSTADDLFGSPENMVSATAIVQEGKSKPVYVRQSNLKYQKHTAVPQPGEEDDSDEESIDTWLRRAREYNNSKNMGDANDDTTEEDGVHNSNQAAKRRLRPQTNSRAPSDGSQSVKRSSCGKNKCEDCIVSRNISNSNNGSHASDDAHNSILAAKRRRSTQPNLQDTEQDTEQDVIERVQVQSLNGTLQNGTKMVQHKGHGKNKCKEVAKLKENQKIKVEFYNNRALSNSLSRHLGRIVRDRNITPVKVKKWSDISNTEQEHIFASITDKFENEDPDIKIDVYKDEIMEHAKSLWINWRGDLHRHFVKPAKTMQQATKNKPKDFDPSDWQWLVQEHFYSKDFIAMSLRNSRNRAGLKMPHRTGSKPFKEIIYNMGGKENRPPTLDELFFETRKKGDTLVDVESSRMHAELVDVVSSDPNLSNVEVMDKCYNGNKRRDHLIGFGGGVKARDVRGPALSKAELHARLRATERENKMLREENSQVVESVNQMQNEWAEMRRDYYANFLHLLEDYGSSSSSTPRDVFAIGGTSTYEQANAEAENQTATPAQHFGTVNAILREAPYDPVLNDDLARWTERLRESVANLSNAFEEATTRAQPERPTAGGADGEPPE